MSTVTYTTVPTKRLAESITSASTSFKVNNITGWDGANLSSADFGSRLWAVFRNSANTLMEIMEIDPTTITAASSPITIIARGLKFTGDQSTSVSGNKLTWVKGDTIVELGTSVPQLLEMTVRTIGDQTIAGVKTFTSVPAATAGPVSGNDLANKTYVDSVVSGGVTIVSKLVGSATAGETVAAGNLVYLKTADGRWWKTTASTAATVEGVILGIAQGSGTAGNSITDGVLLRGVDINQSGMTGGTTMYASNTAGAISSSAGTISKVVGIANSATALYFNPDFTYIDTKNQKDALAGTSGTPSSTNLFVTNDDTSVSANGSKIPRGSGGKIGNDWINTQFGGTGADGALAISSGTTTIDLGNAALVVKNYTSISITGTGQLAFSNPNTAGTVVVLRSQGAVTLTSSTTPNINASGIGAAGGAGVTQSGAGSTDGNTGTAGATTISQWKTNNGTGGDAPTGSGGTGGAVISFQTTDAFYSASNISRLLKSRYPDVFVGGGGGSGGAIVIAGGNGNPCTSGDGGRGGGALIIECGAAWNFTVSNGISVAGEVGVAGSGTGNRASAGGGGGGGGGYFLAIYKTLTANTGTVVTSGGTGGAGYFNEAGGDIATNTGPGGGGGGGLTAGTNGENASNQADAGGAGGTGTSLVIANTEFF